MKSLEEFISRAKGAVDVIGEKAGQFVDVSRLNVKLLEVKSQIKSELEELGKIAYESYSEEEGIENKPEILAQIKCLKVLYEKSEKIKLQIAFMKNKILCKTCGFNNEVGSLYCAKCGENLKKEGTPIIKKNELKEDDFVEFDD